MAAVVTARVLIEKLQPFIGKQIIACTDDIESIAHALGYSVNIIDPQFNTGSIDQEPTRLNIRTDKDSVITSFTVG